MNPRRKRRIIRRLNRRLANTEEALTAYDEVTSNEEVRGKALGWILEQLAEGGIEIDTNKDGKYSDEELADAGEALEDFLDGKKELPQPFEALMDIGVSAVVSLMLALITNRRSRLERRLDRTTRRLTRIQGG